MKTERLTILGCYNESVFATSPGKQTIREAARTGCSDGDGGGCYTPELNGERKDNGRERPSAKQAICAWVIYGGRRKQHMAAGYEDQDQDEL